MESEAMSTTEIAILERIIEPEKNMLPPDVARYLLARDFSPEDRQRLEELQTKAQAGVLTAVEQADLERYRRVADFLDRMRSRASESLATQNAASGSGTANGTSEIPPGIRRSQEAYWRDLPQLLQTRRNRGKWVAYSGEERIGIARTKTELIREIIRGGIPRGNYYTGRIEPDYQAPWEPIEGEPIHPHHFEELPSET